MKLSTVYSKLQQGELLSGDKNFIARVAIEYLANIEGTSPNEIDYSAPEFAKAFPQNLSDLKGKWTGPVQYRPWRNAILSVQMLASPGNTDGDPWYSLFRLEKLLRNSSASTLYDLKQHLPAGVIPQEITDRLLLKSFSILAGTDRRRFRRSVYSLRRLYQYDIAVQSKLLPSEMPQPLPKARDYFASVQMAPELKKLRDSISSRNTLCGFDYLHRLAVVKGFLNAETDSLEDFRKALSVLPEPTDPFVPKIRGQTFRWYRGMATAEDGRRDCSLGSVEQALVDFQTTVRR